ncbi:hypothetical protein DKL61_09155 [Gammaproteobacteria bacterium ESL0073]|nr:hypothetical protein DKL61_09155 [Gammaproteobacteria bacterium ESL0073]
MHKCILSAFFLVLSCSLSMASECQIKEITPKQEANNFTFENILAQDLKVFTETPIKALVNSMPILIFKNKQHVGFQRIDKNFYTQDTLEKSFQEQSVNCQSETPYFVKDGYTFLLKSVEPLPSDSRKTTSVFIIPDPKKTKDYFYFVSFVGFDQQDIIQMLIKDK